MLSWFLSEIYFLNQPHGDQMESKGVNDEILQLVEKHHMQVLFQSSCMLYFWVPFCGDESVHFYL